MRILIDAGGRTGEVAEADLEDLYRPPHLPWLRVNMVSTLDGAANGESGKSGSINNEVDKLVFHALRAQCDAVLVGAGTARTENYREAAVPLVLVSHQGQVPEQLAGATPGKVLMATCASSPGLDAAREVLGADHVIVAGDSQVDLVAVKAALAERGLGNVLSEGGPSLLRDLLGSGAADELTLTWVPRVIGGVHPRIVMGESLDLDLAPALLLEQDGTLLGRWLVRR
ncbi:pyrimidine reductase family protein [Nocardioides marmorisolisilvae]|uniref:Pyrimidine reductase family protein n=1 Tax=Nocardioides marmorisolisilvae TaxID=1542737 RepID=A0A3N0DY10_9ACTN|nr:pyrimidine reductase family protein [Nocardioides marmorisolisilvae]